MGIVEFASNNAKLCTEKLTKAEQKSLGQFHTPESIARFMAVRCISGLSDKKISILEPAAGTGVLAAALIEAILSKDEPPTNIKLTMYELDERLIDSLKQLSHLMRKAAKDKGVSLAISIKNTDFLMAKEVIQQKQIYDIAIANPPYFKINANDLRAVAHAYAVYGQPNIYGLFMAACAALIKPGGKWCFITPRSWTDGLYFSEVRRYMLSFLCIDSIHLFDSRQDHFQDESILQEAVITWATRQSKNNNQMVISSSAGSYDLNTAVLRAVPINEVVDSGNKCEITLQLRHLDNQLEDMNNTLESLGLKVSTGPVIPFRAKEFISESFVDGMVPLLWLQHIKTMNIQWPIRKKKEYIQAIAENAWMLVPNKPMVILRRFSPKEDERRVTASAYIGHLKSPVIGLENHLNYIYRPGGNMNVTEAVGLAVYLNSIFVDSYFRASSGSTQVNATELRKLPLPSSDIINLIGRSYRDGMTLNEMDSLVISIMGRDLYNEVAAEG